VLEGPEAWYGWKVLRKIISNPLLGISYAIMREACIKCYQAAGLVTHQPTHGGRKSEPAAQRSSHNTSIADLAMMGGWDSTCGRSKYMIVQSPEALAQNAGFDNHFLWFLPRALLNPGRVKGLEAMFDDRPFKEAEKMLQDIKQVKLATVYMCHAAAGGSLVMSM
jgi:hypothetical protein